MEEKLKMQVDFIIFSHDFFDPMIITKELKINSSSSYKKGDVIDKTIIKRKCSAWVLSEASCDEIDLSILISRLLDVLIPKEKEIKRLCVKYNLETQVGCVVYIRSIAPIINLSEDIISKIYKLKASLDIDII